MCPNQTLNHWLGISSGNSTSLTADELHLSNAEVGLDLYDDGVFYLVDCVLSDNSTSVQAYDSLVDFSHDQVLNSPIGIASYHSAVPYLAWNNTGQNIVSDNTWGLYAVQSVPYLDEGLNNFVNTGEGQLNIVTYDFSGEIKAQQNWWGYSGEQQIKDTFSNYEDINYSSWCQSPNGNAGKLSSSNDLILAETARMNGDWNLAIQYYYQVLNDSLITTDDIQALKGCTVCHSKINQIGNYLTWLSDRLLTYQSNDEFRKELLHTQALCNRLIGNYQEALDYYISILDSNPSVVDSCFALIDLGFTWFESDASLRNKYADLMPPTQLEQVKKARIILASIYTPGAPNEQVVPSPPVLYNNYPNPFNPTTTIEFFIPQTGIAKLNVYNIKGQKVRTLIDSDLGKGEHRVIWNGKDSRNRSVASGVYFFRLESGGKVAIRKATLLK
jgi:tetratricopeptide (TPR) repeat protein